MDADVWKRTNIPDIEKLLGVKTSPKYGVYHCTEQNGMWALRDFFPNGEANELNFCLFSTGGVEGSYTTIEGAEKDYLADAPYHESDFFESVTFLIVQPRTICLFYGNCTPTSGADFEFLKSLRESSWKIVKKIGKEE